ncbi:MAG TPA: hypothetical protein DCE42_23470, partial [Myxococcales bacterium]|nr:hypothetical protein [Myxococcales bacterium]
MNREDIFQVLKELVSFYQTGVLSEDEFQESKKILLKEMYQMDGGHTRAPVPSSPSSAEILALLESMTPLPVSVSAQQSGLVGALELEPGGGLGQSNAQALINEREEIEQVLRDLQNFFHAGLLSEDDFHSSEQLVKSRLSNVFGEAKPSRVPSQPSHVPSQPPRGSSSGYLPSTFHAQPSHQQRELSVKQYLLGRYYLEKLLGQGGMGQVFLCYDTVRESRYALKLIHPHLAQFDEIRTRFLQELRANERLTHPGIVRTYTLEQDPNSGFLFFTMEYVEGVTLDLLMERSAERGIFPSLSVKSVIKLFDELIPILEYAHAQGVIHRDLKPSNIMITRDGRVKLMDFGIAKVLEGESVSRHTGFSGFVYYMAPEQLRGGDEVSKSVDVFSLGVIAYQLFTTELPIGSIFPPSQLCMLWTKAVDEVVLRAMDPKPHRRYQTPGAFWSALREILLPISLQERSEQHARMFRERSTHSSKDTGFNTSYWGIKDESALDVLVEQYQQIEKGEEAAPRDAISEPSVPPQPEPMDFQQTRELNAVREKILRRVGGVQEREERGHAKQGEEAASVRDEQPVMRYPSALSLVHPSRSGGDVEKPTVTSPEKQVVEKTVTPQLLLEYEEMISLDSLSLTPSKKKRAIEPVHSAVEWEAESVLPLAATTSSKPAEKPQPKKIWNALDLPAVPDPVRESIFRAKDGTPLLRFVEIPGGVFTMGSKENDMLAYRNEAPQREVELETYWIARTPLTNRVWLKFIEESGYHCESPDYLQHWVNGQPDEERLEHPVVCVSYEDVQAFCSFYELTLPTEAQWEKAARGTEGQIWPWGNQKPHNG